MRKLQTLFVIILVTLAGSPAFAASGGSPNGKPFVEINGQIAEVKGQVRTLTDRVEQLEHRVSSVELGQERVFQEIAVFDQVLAELKTLALSTDHEVESLKDHLLIYEHELSQVQLDLQALGYADEVTKLQIQTLEELILAVEEVVYSNDKKLEDQIAITQDILGHLEQQKAYFEDQLRLKQNIVNGKCDDGFLVVGLTDGELACESEREVLKNGGIYWVSWIATTSKIIQVSNSASTADVWCNQSDPTNTQPEGHYPAVFAIASGVEVIPYGYKLRSSRPDTQNSIRRFVTLERDFLISLPNPKPPVTWTAWVKCIGIQAEQS